MDIIHPCAKRTKIKSLFKSLKARENLQRKLHNYVQGPPLGIDIMYLVLADRNMQVRFGLKVVWES